LVLRLDREHAGQEPTDLRVLLVATFKPTADGAEHGIAGLVQRLLLLQIHGWFVAMGMLAYLRANAE